MPPKVIHRPARTPKNCRAKALAPRRWNCNKFAHESLIWRILCFLDCVVHDGILQKEARKHIERHSIIVRRWRGESGGRGSVERREEKSRGDEMSR